MDATLALGMGRSVRAAGHTCGEEDSSATYLQSADYPTSKSVPWRRGEKPSRVAGASDVAMDRQAAAKEARPRFPWANACPRISRKEVHRPARPLARRMLADHAAGTFGPPPALCR